MTQDDVIKMAREALKQEPREDWNSTAWVFADETLEAFAKLVAAHEREACAKVLDEMANQMVEDMEPSTAVAWVRSKAEEIRARRNK